MSPFGFSSIGPESNVPETPKDKASADVDQVGALGAHSQDDDDLWNLTTSNYLRDAAWADQAWQ